MLTIPADIILEKNKLFSGESFIELLEWQISETSATVRVANYNEDVYWGHNTWSKFRFEGSGEQDSGGDSAETIQIKVSAIDRVIQGQLETLTNGGIGDTVIYRRVHSAYLHLSAVITASFSILDIDAGPSGEWVTFNLGQENFFLSQFPANVFRRDVCRYRPTQTDVCPYVNNPLCSRSFDDCIYLNQESVFGGQPGIPGGVFNINISRAQTKLFYLDAKLHKTGQTSLVSVDAILVPGSASVITSLDALLNQPGSKPYPPVALSIDSQISELIQKTLSVDSKLAASGQISSTSIDALIYGDIETSIDALVAKIGNLKTLNIDTILNKEQTGQLNIDSQLQKAKQAESALDAKLIKEQTLSTAIDSMLYSIGTYSESAKLDAILYGEFIEDTDGDAILDTDGDAIGAQLDNV